MKLIATVRRTAFKFALTSALAASFAFAAVPVAARGMDSESLGVRAEALPAPGPQVFRAIRSGGPFGFEKDGTVFGNREGLLPQQRRGYYREYTVAAPGMNNRGARRIVCGGPPRTPDACWYTADHYASFRRIVE